MQTIKIFYAVFIVLLFNITCCNGDTCQCNCCVGNFCTATLQGTIPVSSCASSSCDSLCKSQYSKCTEGPGSTIYQCKTDGRSTPNWPGTFSMGNRCDRTKCCCPVGQMTLSPAGGNALRVQCQFSGYECPGGSLSYDQTITTPTGFSTLVSFLGNLIPVSLSEDSRTIQLTNPAYPRCSETATRSGSPSAGSTNLAWFFLFSSLLTIKHLMI